MPISSSRCPSIPRNETLERSGSLRAASPPPCDCANALGAATEKATIANKKLMIRRRCAATKFDIDFTIKKILPFRLGDRREKCLLIKGVLLPIGAEVSNPHGSPGRASAASVTRGSRPQKILSPLSGRQKNRTQPFQGCAHISVPFPG